MREMELKIITVEKEKEILNNKVQELVRQTHEKVDTLKTIEAKQLTAEKQTTSKLKELKQKHKSVIADMQSKLDYLQQENKSLHDQTIKHSDTDQQIRSLMA